MDAHAYFHLICLPYTQNTCTRIIILAHSCTINDVYSHNDTRKSLYRISRILSDTLKNKKQKNYHTDSIAYTNLHSHICTTPYIYSPMSYMVCVFNKHITTNTNTRERERERERQRQRQRERQRQRDRETERDRERERDAHAYRE